MAGEAHNGPEVIEFLQQKSVDVVLMDIEIPNLNGIEATCRVKKLFPEVRVIAYRHAPQKCAEQATGEKHSRARAVCDGKETAGLN
ncbi:MAG: response regulator [Rudanella sp.]|nr:response regulator [Rudanella sp.]